MGRYCFTVFEYIFQYLFYKNTCNEYIACMCIRIRIDILLEFGITNQTFSHAIRVYILWKRIPYVISAFGIVPPIVTARSNCFARTKCLPFFVVLKIYAHMLLYIDFIRENFNDVNGGLFFFLSFFLFLQIIFFVVGCTHTITQFVGCR